MGRPREIIDPRRISLVLSAKQKARVERHALYQGSQEGKSLPLAEFLRRIIDIACPPEDKTMNFK